MNEWNDAIATHPKWHYMSPFIESQKIMAAYISLDEFDWLEHFTKVGAELTDRGGDTELEEISDRALRDTPIVEWMTCVKEAVVEMDNRLRATAAAQRQLLSTTLLKPQKVIE
jgi:hypothetical protein